MPDIREAVIEIRFIAKRAIGNLVKFFTPHPNKIGHNRVL